jgi:signal peptidase I
MPEDRDPALDPAPEREDRLFPPVAASDGGRERRSRPGVEASVGDDHDDDRLFPPLEGRDPAAGSTSSGGADDPTSAGEASAAGGVAGDRPSPGDGRSTADERPTDGDGRPTADERPTDDDGRPTADERPTDDDGRPTADERPTDEDDARGGAASTSPPGASGGPSSGASGASSSAASDAVGSEAAGRGRAKGANSFLRELPVLLLIAFVLAFVLRTFVVQVFYIPSGSMEPTLQVDDRMVVEKITYLFREPARGEVAVFEGDSFGEIDPEATAGERFVRGVGQFLGLVPASARDFVKRVIGLPGDEILIEGGTVFVNGDPLDEPYVVFEDPSDFGPITVPDGQLFFLGDNRPNSSDSRRSLGYVGIDQVVGRAAYIIWPPDNAGSLMGTEYAEPVEPVEGS